MSQSGALLKTLIGQIMDIVASGSALVLFTSTSPFLFSFFLVKLKLYLRPVYHAITTSMV